MKTVEVFADVTCPFAHVGLRRFVAERDARGIDLLLRVRAWPLERVNGHAETGNDLAPKVQALRGSVAPELFRGFDADSFPSTSWPALVAEATAYRTDPARGERFSMAVRTALFEDGRDISDAKVLAELSDGLSNDDTDADGQVIADWHDGQGRQVIGSPHFFVDGYDFFCPSMTVERSGGVVEIAFDKSGFDEFLSRALQ